MSKPVSGTKEWSTTSENIQVGCEHDCRYGYCRENALKFGRIRDPEQWRHPVLSRDKLRRKRFPRREGVIMFPSMHDITPLNINAVIPYMRMMLKAGNRVLIVSKPHMSCVKAMCDELGPYRDQILFRFTIGSTDDRALKFWEPGAPPFQERLDALKYAFINGFATSVSSEPYLDSTIVDLVQICAPYITDAHWIGLMNKKDQRVDMHGWTGEMKGFMRTVCEVQDRESIELIYKAFKDDPKVKWKESIKGVVGLPRPTEPGLDV